MNKNIQEFFKKLAEDPQLVAKLGASQNPEEAYRLASSLQDGFTREEFEDAMSKAAAALENADGGELSDEDLTKISGGSTGDMFATALSGIVISGATATAAASAAI